MRKESKWNDILISLLRYIVFFLLIAFVTTCCMELFITSMTRTMNLTLSAGDLETAAKLTFGNVMLLSLLITVIDRIRRKLMVDRPAKKITEAAAKIMQGNFSVRIETNKSLDAEDRFNEIIDYFNKMAEELAGIETLRTDFIANVSHELKTPLSIIQNYGTMLQKPGLSEEKRTEYAKAITDASRRMADLISNILKLNKLENQQIFPASEIYNLGEQLCECLLGFEELWETKEIEIETDLTDGVLVKSDPEMMRLVWNNLFSNAIKFTEPGGKIGLTLQARHNRAVVRISDTGCGISQEVGERMFDKFYQGDTSHATQGNGLGLALVKRVIDITGGDISVESEVGKGTTFTITMRRIPDGADQTITN